MTKNLDLARECGAHAIPCEIQTSPDHVPAMMVVFQGDQLDAFAERVRADDAARIAELEAQLEAVGAGGVSALMPWRKPLSEAEAQQVVSSVQTYRGDYAVAVLRATEAAHEIK